MAKNKDKKPKGYGKEKAEITSMIDNSADSRNSKTGYMNTQNSKQNQLK